MSLEFIAVVVMTCQCMDLLHLMVSFRANMWNSMAEFLNKASALGICEGRLEQSGDKPKMLEVAEKEEEEQGGVATGGLWEDRSLAGFMLLKPSLGTMETFSLPQMKRLNSKVSHQSWSQL